MWLCCREAETGPRGLILIRWKVRAVRRRRALASQKRRVSDRGMV